MWAWNTNCKSSDPAEIKAHEAKAVISALAGLGIINFHRDHAYPCPASMYVILALLDYIWDDNVSRWRIGQMCNDGKLPALEIWAKRAFKNTCLVTDNTNYLQRLSDVVISIKPPKRGLAWCVKRLISEVIPSTALVRAIPLSTTNAARAKFADRRAKRAPKIRKTACVAKRLTNIVKSITL